MVAPIQMRLYVLLEQWISFPDCGARMRWIQMLFVTRLLPRVDELLHGVLLSMLYGKLMRMLW